MVTQILVEILLGKGGLELFTQSDTGQRKTIINNNARERSEKLEVRKLGEHDFWDDVKFDVCVVSK